jgi:hypothetical protein
MAGGDQCQQTPSDPFGLQRVSPRFLHGLSGLSRAEQPVRFFLRSAFRYWIDCRLWLFATARKVP